MTDILDGAPETIWVMPPYYTLHGEVPDIRWQEEWDRSEGDKAQSFGDDRRGSTAYTLKATADAALSTMQAHLDELAENCSGFAMANVVLKGELATARNDALAEAAVNIEDPFTRNDIYSKSRRDAATTIRALQTPQTHKEETP